MLRIRRYLNPYMFMFTVSVILLFIQANLDLALPDYLSRIVNTGIQQSGVESAVPEAMRQETLNHLALFLSDEDETAVRNAYTLIEPNTLASEQYVETYPLLQEVAIYVRQDLTDEEIDALKAPISQALLVVSSLQRAMDDPEAAAQMGGGGAFNLSQLPPGTDLFALIGNLPAAQRSQIADTINEQFSALGESMVEQTAVVQVKAEYEALGLDVASLQSSYILRIGALMLGITLLSAAATITVGYLSAKIAAGIGRDLRSDIFRKVESFSSAEFEKFPTASLITRSTNDITQLQMVTMFMVRLVFYAPIMGIGGTIRAIGKGSSMWWTIAVAVIVLVGVIAVIVSIAMPRFQVVQKLIDRINLVARENLSGMMVIRAFNMQGFEEKRFDKANLDLTDNTLFIARITAVMMPVMMFILNVLSVLIIWVGAQQVADANMQVGDVMAFLQYAMQIVFSFLMLSMLFIILPRAQVSAERIADVLETEPIITDPANPHQLNGSFTGTVEFRNVSFRYPGADTDVLKDISFVARPGETTAFIGSTGSGKSTVVNLIPRFFDVTEGQILLDGVDIREVTQHDLREKIGYVPQKGVLFSGTIESNLRYADELASMEDLQTAVTIAQAAEFVDSKPEGLTTEIAQGGTNVSGGQRQRLSIARALVRKPPIYIFDDSFSALDFKTDAALRRALYQTTHDSTILIVTQRVSTVKNAEQIVVLDRGCIVGKGTHEELMESCETYQEIALSQLSMEELSS
ncbi:MAG: ABC transporter ATP-binding protein [Ardenticatenaceae bacterium]|nr:ABC transporter ATP-binding protein [Ardenticatenaceae bacterium]MCB8972479.1 ABC transporter ATP-binding protein [Ardenticatenaceae bacterium]